MVNGIAPMRLLSPHAGVECDGAPENQSLAQFVESNVVKYGLLVVRHASLSRESFTVLSAELGSPVPPPYLDEIAEGTGVSALSNVVQATEFDSRRQTVFASGWHSDWTFLQSYPDISCLYCLVAPEAGGDTLFADTSPGYNQFSPLLRTWLRDVTCVHSSSKSYSSSGVYSRLSVVGAHPRMSGKTFTARHPLLLESPVSRVSSVCISPTYVESVDGLKPDESDWLIKFVIDALLQHEFMFRVSWSDDCLIVWDNHRFLHRALNQGIIGRRELLRSNIRLTPFAQIP